LLDVGDRYRPAPEALLDGADAGHVRHRLLDRGHVREAVGPLQVGHDDDLVRGDHGLVQVARRHHGKQRVGQGAADLGLVVGHDGQAAPLGDHGRHHLRLGLAPVVSDDRDDVAVGHLEAGVHHELGRGAHLRFRAGFFSH
jgi:hypothetical protein